MQRIQHDGLIRFVPEFLSLCRVSPSDETWVQTGLIISDSQFMKIVSEDLTVLDINLDFSQLAQWFHCLCS